MTKEEGEREGWRDGGMEEWRDGGRKGGKRLERAQSRGSREPAQGAYGWYGGWNVGSAVLGMHGQLGGLQRDETRRSG
jgi:hypothetical protein